MRPVLDTSGHELRAVICGVRLSSQGKIDLESYPERKRIGPTTVGPGTRKSKPR